MIEKKDINSILLAIYIWMFMLLRVVWAFNSTFSTPILAACAISIVGISIIKTRSFINYKSIKSWILIILICIVLISNFYRAENDLTFTRMYEFIIYGAIPMSLFSQMKDYDLFLKTYSALSMLIFILYIFDPINDYFISGTYMEYGYQAILPAFFGIHIASLRKRKFIYVFLEIVCLIALLIFANRMSIISALVFVLLIDLTNDKFTARKLLKYFLIFLFSLLILLNINSILLFILNSLSEAGYYSYSLFSIITFFQGTNLSFDAGRFDIWNDAWELIKLNPVIGYGVGFFENYYGLYSHNIFLDFLLSFGITGMIVLLALLVNSTIKTFKSNESIKLVGILFLVTSFPKLLTSIYYFIEPMFWLFILYGIIIPNNNYRNKLREENVYYEKNI